MAVVVDCGLVWCTFITATIVQGGRPATFNYIIQHLAPLCEVVLRPVTLSLWQIRCSGFNQDRAFRTPALQGSVLVLALSLPAVNRRLHSSFIIITLTNYVPYVGYCLVYPVFLLGIIWHCARLTVTNFVVVENLQCCLLGNP